MLLTSFSVSQSECTEEAKQLPPKVVCMCGCVFCVRSVSRVFVSLLRVCMYVFFVLVFVRNPSLLSAFLTFYFCDSRIQGPGVP
jgi:hypothetical protein